MMLLRNHQWMTLAQSLKHDLSVSFQNKSVHIRTLLSDLPLEDRKPTQLLRKMTLLAADKISDLLKLLWLQRLPSSTQQILTSSSEDLPGLANIADKILEVTGTLPADDSVNTDSNNIISRLEAHIEELTQTIRGFSFPSKNNPRRYANQSKFPSVSNRSKSPFRKEKLCVVTVVNEMNGTPL
ncbi:hypothetical protein AVEN_89083-1 [Araneus ventricosus]|uniref:Uncharacterized protein n=1 Tax=Araneus ventricosus TaxID=182803 RepID=A0A4Y2B404_ARAVE|nr:hypothetical protein AVEN_89083-1 [Araneus ventricosus]